MTAIGSYYLKTHAAQVIRAAESGEVFIVSINGKGVCQINPIGYVEPEDSYQPEQILTQVRVTQSLLPPAARLTSDEILQLVREGRP